MRNILIIVFTLFALNVFSQGRFGTNGDLEPTGNYGIVKARNLKGGYLGSVHDTVARNLIPMTYRDSNTLVFTRVDSTLWMLKGGLANEYWTIFSTGGGVDTTKVPYTGANQPLISPFYIQGSSMRSDTMRAATSSGFRMYSSSGSEIGVFGAGGTNFGNYVGRQSYRTNINGSLSSLDFVPKRYVDSVVAGSAVTGKVYSGNGLANVNDSTLRTDTSLTATKDFVNYKDDIQQGFIDMRKLESDSSASDGYTRRDRLQQQLDSANVAQRQRINDSLNNLNRLKAGTSAGVQLFSNSGTKVAEWGLGGGANFDFNGFAGYDANRSASYTDRSFTDKKFVDSTAALLARLAAVNIFTTRNTFNGALFGNKDSIPISTTNQWILAIDTVTGAITRINRIAAFVPNADTTITGNYTLTQRDLGRAIYCTNTSLITITIPTGLTTGITLVQDRRYNIGVYQEGTGNGLVQFAGSGVTLQSTEGATKTRVANSYAEIKFKSDTVVKLVGDII